MKLQNECELTLCKLAKILDTITGTIPVKWITLVMKENFCKVRLFRLSNGSKWSLNREWNKYQQDKWFDHELL